MKKEATVVMAMFLVMVSTTAAQTRLAKVEAGTKNYLTALRSGNEGLVGSAMMQLAKIKIVYPAFNTTEVKHVIDSLAVNSSSPSIRYKAYLASSICGNPSRFAAENYSRFQDNDEFFATVWTHVQELVLSSRAN